MVYKSYRKKRGFSRKYKHGTFGGMSLGLKAYQMANKLTQNYNSELKTFDTDTNIAPDVNATLVCLTSMAQGTADNERIGKSIQYKSIQVKGAINFDPTKPTEILRVMIVKDKNSVEGAAPLITDILKAGLVNEFPAVRNRERFSILYDKKFTQQVAGQTRIIDYFHQFKPHKDNKGNYTLMQHGTFKGITEDDFDSNHVWLIYFGNQSTAGTTSNILVNSRLRYIDN